MADQNPKQAGVKQGTTDPKPAQRDEQRQIGGKGLGGDTGDDMVGVGPSGAGAEQHAEHAEPGGEEKTKGDVRRVGRDEEKDAQGFGSE